MEFLCSLVVKIELQCLIKTYQRHPKIFWKANPSNSYRLSFWNFPSSVFLQPISALHSVLPAWRRTRTTRSVGTLAWPDCWNAALGTGATGTWALVASAGMGYWVSGPGRFLWFQVGSGLSGARRHAKQCVRKKIAKQHQLGMHHTSTWLSGFISLPHLQARPRLLVVYAHMSM